MKQKIWVYFLLSTYLLACAPTPIADISDPSPLPVRTPTSEATITAPATEQTAIKRPFPQHSQYAPNSILPNHRSQAELDEDVRNFYDYWKSAYVLEAGLSENEIMQYRIAFGKSEEAQQITVSEGQGFGMIIVPIMAGYDSDAQTIFDGLWEFARLHPSEIDSRLMDWNIPLEEGNASAFDGDADIAFGLLLADAQWGSEGRINYKAEANKMINAIAESTIGPESHLPMLGDWVNVGEPQYNQYTPRSSDFMLVNFRAFGKSSGNPLWDEVVRQSQNVMTQIQSTYSPQSGLMPDFIVFQNNSPQPALANFLEADTDGAFNYNAGRVPWRIGLDALLFNDPTSRAIVQKISRWVQTNAENNPAQIRSGFNLDGSPLPNSDYFTTFFAAPMGVAAMNDPSQQSWLNAIYNSVYLTHEDYYEDSVNLLCLLVMTGNYWAP